MWCIAALKSWPTVVQYPNGPKMLSLCQVERFNRSSISPAEHFFLSAPVLPSANTHIEWRPAEQAELEIAKSTPSAQPEAVFVHPFAPVVVVISSTGVEVESALVGACFLPSCRANSQELYVIAVVVIAGAQ